MPRLGRGGSGGARGPRSFACGAQDDKARWLTRQGGRHWSASSAEAWALLRAAGCPVGCEGGSLTQLAQGLREFVCRQHTACALSQCEFDGVGEVARSGISLRANIPARAHEPIGKLRECEFTGQLPRELLADGCLKLGHCCRPCVPLPGVFALMNPCIPALWSAFHKVQGSGHMRSNPYPGTRSPACWRISTRSISQESAVQ